MATEQFQQAIQLFDQANALDPNKEIFEEKEFPKELLYGQRMTEMLSSFEPEASEAVQLAARCQHICRWEIPRDSYEMNRTGYLLWRTELKKFHAQKAGEILSSVGYDQETIEKVSFLLQKKQLKRNEETQLVEDVICLVFLQFYYDPFIEKHSEEKIVDIVQKTWKKMSEKGHDAALQLSYSEKGLALVKKALGL
ncbi:DUF4202 domain-containing protein [Flavicella marina]|uniref:DUF4202 domain-containing protein n=1 Tax=Flavicella marina TaxID=1475951 RepID=UPI001265830C|nr:DUF4202 domain-containing protein [Flavicella marina]